MRLLPEQSSGRQFARPESHRARRVVMSVRQRPRRRDRSSWKVGAARRSNRAGGTSRVYRQQTQHRRTASILLTDDPNTCRCPRSTLQQRQTRTSARSSAPRKFEWVGTPGTRTGFATFRQASDAIFYWLYCNEFVVLIKRNFKASTNTIVGNKLPDCAGGESNNPVVIGACDDFLYAALIISQILLSRDG